MKIVGVTACTGCECKLETQGTIGVQNKLTDQEIKDADVVIIAHDIQIGGMERFKGKHVVDIPISVAMKSPKSLIATIQKKLNIK
jgi:PTS system fructose-specific IIB component